MGHTAVPGSSVLRREFVAVGRLAFPLALVQLSYHGVGFVDTLLAGHADAVTLGAVGLGNALFFTGAVFGIGVMLGLDALVNQSLGAEDPEGAIVYTLQAVRIAVVSSLATALALGLGVLTLPWFGVVDALVEPTRHYVWARLPGLFPLFCAVGFRSYLQARGMTFAIVVTALLNNVINFVLDWALLFGDTGLEPLGFPSLGLPALGALGIGIASSISQVFLGASLWWVFRRAIPRDLLAWRWRPGPARKVWQVGFPVGLQIVGEVGFFAVLGIAVGHLGVVDSGAHHAAVNVASLTFALAVGVGGAASIRVGRAVGAKEPAAARAAGVASMGIITLVMLACAVVMWVFPGPIAARLAPDGEVAALTAELLILAGMFQVVDGLQGVMAGALRGLGDTRAIVMRYVGGLWLGGLPLALGLGLLADGGVRGVWIGIIAGLAAVAALLCHRFLRATEHTMEETP